MGCRKYERKDVWIMDEFQYTVQDKLGMHARPVGLLVNLVKTFDGAVTVTKGGKTVGADSLVGLMSLGVKQGDVITVSMEDDGENVELEKLKHFVKNNF